MCANAAVSCGNCVTIALVVKSLAANTANSRNTPRKVGRVTSPIRTAVRVAAAGALLFGLLGAGPASAQVTRVVTADFAPLTDNSSPDRKGLLYELVKEMMKLQNIDKTIDFMTWPEAMAEVKKKNTVAFPVTRSKEREANFVWLTKIFDMDRSFTGKPGSAAINTVDDAKRLKAVGTTVNSASLAFLKAKGLPNIKEFESSRKLMEALLAGDVDVVYQPAPFCKTDWKAAGGQGALVFGEPQERSAAYLAADKESTLNPADWQEALKVLEQDGTFEKLTALYGMN
jgi:polar amino acid transport system substrate-binding protein